MRRILVVLAIIAGTAFIGVAPASAEDAPSGDTVTTTETTPDTTTEEAPDPAPAPEPETAPATTDPAPAPVTEAAPAPEESTQGPADVPPPAAEGDKTDAPATDAKTADVTEADAVIAAAKERVTICHETDSQTNPYVTNRPAEDGGDLEGHSGHTGPIWFEGIEGEWGDIIPPFDYDGGHFDGLNWTEEGQAIYNNGCNLPDVELTEVTATEPTLTPATCSEPGTLTLPDIEGVIYTSDPSPIDGPGDYEVFADAAPGYVLSDDSWTGPEVFTVADVLDDESCPKVTLCHATFANPQADNPYNEITVGKPAAVNGHAGHTGPIYQDGFKESKTEWGDIIPPFDYGPNDSLHFDGLNWTAEGQAILRNGCNLIDVVDQTVPDFVLLDRCTGNIVDSNDDDTTQIVPLAGDGNYTWEFTQGDGQNGPWTLEFTAKTGFELSGTSTFSGDAGSSADCAEPEEATLPNTGGSSLWVLVLGGGLALAGLLVLSGRGALGLVGLTGPVPIEAPTSAWVQTVATKRQVAAVQAKPRRGLLAMLGGLVALVIASLFGRRP